MGAETAAVVVRMLCDSVKLRQQLEAEILVLRLQLSPAATHAASSAASTSGRPGFVHLVLPALPGHS
jgi:hypothetical protein